jgi:predicted dehydrogenase
MSAIGFGIVGTGMIAKAIADAIQTAAGAQLVAVSSRTQGRAEAFVAGRPGTRAVEGLADLLACDDVEAVYVAIPTAAKEDCAMAAIAAGKHVLVDKPFVDVQSVDRMAGAAAARGLVFMDATHFVHHPRRDVVRAALAARIGTPRVLHSLFYTGLDDRSNIRFDPAREPTGALGDLGWYCMRATVEYLQPQSTVKQAEAVCRRDPETGAVTQVTGVLAFESGESASFGAGFQKPLRPRGCHRDGRFRDELDQQFRLPGSRCSNGLHLPPRTDDAQGFHLRRDPVGDAATGPDDP